MDNTEKIATYGTQDDKNTTQYVSDTTICKQTQITQIRYKQLEVKMNQASFFCRNRNGHHSTELRT